MSERITPYDRLEAIAKTLREGGPSPKVSVRDFLSWFGVQRRGSWKVRDIKDSLKRAGLHTYPDFYSTWIDGPITFELTELQLEPAGVERTGQIADSGTDSNPTSAPPNPLNAVATARQADTLETEISPSSWEALAPEEAGPSPEAVRVAGGETENIRPSEEETGPQELRLDEPSHQISKLKQANIPPQRVAPDASLMQAITIMLTNNFSQVPVMPNERDVKGVVTWQSIGSRLSFGPGATTVREVMDRRVAEVPSDTSIFDAIAILIESGYVLVRGLDGRIVGIVTSSDLSLQFQELAEPFLLLGDIETRIRSVIADHFDLADLESVRDPNNPGLEIDSVDDLSFGQYVRLLENPDQWPRAGLKVDRKIFIAALENVHRIRNAVMHFDPDSTTEGDLQSLRDFARFLKRLRVLGVA